MKKLAFVSLALVSSFAIISSALADPITDSVSGNRVGALSTSARAFAGRGDATTDIDSLGKVPALGMLNGLTYTSSDGAERFNMSADSGSILAPTIDQQIDNGFLMAPVSGTASESGKPAAAGTVRLGSSSFGHDTGLEVNDSAAVPRSLLLLGTGLLALAFVVFRLQKRLYRIGWFLQT